MHLDTTGVAVRRRLLAAALVLAPGAAAAQTALVVAPVGGPAAAAAAVEPPTVVVLSVRRGDTLAELLDDAGVGREEAQSAVEALAPLFAARDLRPGQAVALRLDPAQDNALLALEIAPGPGWTVLAERLGPGWSVEERRATRRRHLVRAEGALRGGLFPALVGAGVPAPLALDLVRELAHQLDFQRDLHPGDRFAVLFERFRDGDGDLLGHGRVLHLDLELGAGRLAVWRFEAPGDGDSAEWYDAQGRPLRRAFLRTPLDGARVSSGYGMRRHPMLGFTRMHQGIDFAAPTGTPVYAAADGVVATLGTERGYGRIVRLRHAGGVETRYAHLSRFAKGLSRGKRVRQGEVIAAVGSTGRSTGPHLHYEIAVEGEAVDPADTRVAAAEPLRGRALAGFQEARRDLERRTAALAGRQEVALAE